MTQLKIYFARAMDGIAQGEIMKLAEEVGQQLSYHDCQLLDPYLYCQSTWFADKKITAAQVVETDLALLKQADGVLMDLTVTSRSYIGCACELVYAHLQNIPVAAYVGESNNDMRLWLQYHAKIVCKERDDAITALLTLIRR